MADNGEIDLIAGQKAFNQLTKLITQTEEADKKMLALADHALLVNKNLSSITTPKGLNELIVGNQELSKQYKTLLTETEALKKKVAELNTARQTARKGITQERVDTQILNTEKRRELTLTSDVAGSYRKLSAQVAIASQRYQNLLVRGRALGQSQKQYNKELLTAQKEFRGLQNRVLEADKAVDKWSRTGERSVGILKNLVAAFGIATGITAFATMSQDIFNTVKEIQSLDLALRSVTETQENFYAQQAFLNDLAEKHGLEINDLTKQYTAFYVAAKDKLAGSQIQQVFRDISRSGSALGLSNDSLARSFTAVNQMLSKGTIASEELRGQLAEAMPGAVQAMTRAVQKLHPEIKNLTEKGLFQMIKDGKILAREVLPETAKELVLITGANNAEKIDTLTKSTNRLKDEWVEFVRVLKESPTGDFFGNIFNNAIKGSKLFLSGLKEILATQHQINLLRESETFQEGVRGFEEQFDYSVGKKSVEEQKKYLEKSKKELTDYVNSSEKKVEKLTVKIRKASFFSPETELKETAEEISRDIGRSKGQLKAIEDKLREIVNPPKVELTDDQKKAEDDRLKALYEANKKEIELRLLKSDTILNGDLTSYSDQYKALQNSESLKLMLLKLAYDEQVRLAKGNANKIKSADLDFQMAIIKQTQETGAKLKSIREKQNEEYIQQLKDVEKFLKDHEKEKVRISEIREDQALEQFMIGWNARKKAYDEEAARLKKLKEQTDDYLSSFSEEFLSNSGFGETFDTFFKQIETIDEKGNKVMTNMFTQLLKGADGTAEKFGVYFTAIAESAQEAFNFIAGLSQKNFDQERERLESQKEIAIAFAGESASSREEIERQVEQKKKEIANREAKAKKTQALYNIGLDTAQAVVAALPNIPLSIAVGALGALQLAFVAAKEVPKYFRGTDNHPGGPMIVNDGSGPNFKETIIYPDGTIEKPQTRNFFRNAPKGTKVLTHDQALTHDKWKMQLDNMIFANEINWSQSNNPNSGSSGINKSDLTALGNGIVNAIHSKKEFSFSIDKKGFNASIIDGNTRRTILNNEINSTGIKV